MAAQASLPVEGSWSLHARIGPPEDEKARVMVWTPGELDSDPGERNVDVDVYEPLTPAEAARLAEHITSAATHAQEIAAWAVPRWEAAAGKRAAEAARTADVISQCRNCSQAIRLSPGGGEPYWYHPATTTIWCSGWGDPAETGKQAEPVDPTPSAAGRPGEA